MSNKRTGRPRKYDNWTAQILNERANEYFLKCDQRVKTIHVPKEGLVTVPAPAPYTIEGLCDYLDITPYEFNVWKKHDTEIGARAKKIYNKITANRVTGALDGSQNSAFAQFLLKNNNPEDYRDKIEVENPVAAEALSMFAEWSKQWKAM